MDKLGRNYSLTIGTEGGGSVTIEPPFTVQFDITRNTLTSANVCQIRIYNLSLRTRNKIRFNISNYGEYRPIEFRAGYGRNIPRIFNGNISAAWSVREGVDFITQIECYDGGFAFVNAETSQQFAAGSTNRSVIENLASSLPNVTRGVFGDYPGNLTRGIAFSGNTTGILADLTGGGFFIDDGRANALGSNEYINDAGATLVINAKSGLLGTPVLEQTIVRFDMLFEPNLNVGRRIKLESLTEAGFDGYYKVTAVKHRGMISESVCGSAITTGEFFYSQILTGVR